MVAEQGKVEVTCEFCGKNYGYRDVEIRELFAAAKVNAGQTLQ